jgi:hypothetical protein
LEIRTIRYAESGRATMNGTQFPTTPKDVEPLSVQEFTFGVDLHDAPSLDGICGRFGNDTNRALVWYIRVRALAAWCARRDAVEGLTSCSEACEVAAGFELNDDWEFDARDFSSAVAVLVSRRPRTA